MSAWNVTTSQTLKVSDARLGAAADPVALVGTFATTASFTSAAAVHSHLRRHRHVQHCRRHDVHAFDRPGRRKYASLSKSGDGTLVLKAASTRTGFTLINAGVLRVENATALGTAGGNSITVFPGATMEIAGVTLDKPFFLQSGTLAASGRRAPTVSCLSSPATNSRYRRSQQQRRVHARQRHQ